MDKREFMRILSTLSTRELAKLYTEATEDREAYIFTPDEAGGQPDDDQRQQVINDLKNMKPNN